MPRAGTWAYFLVLWLGFTGCFRSCDSNVVATLVKAEGQVEGRITADWLPSSAGQTFVQGNALRTGPTSRAELVLADDGQLSVSPDSVVWFGEPEQPFDLKVGAAELVAGQATQVAGLDLAPKDSIAVRVGPEGRSKLQVKRSGQRSLSVSFGLAVIEKSEPPAPSTDVDAGVVDSGPPPLIPELRLDLSQSPTVHTPRVPIRIAAVGECDGAELTARRGRRRLKGVGAVALPPGRWRLKSACPDSTVQGIVEILRDSGTARLVRRPPNTKVDADGRTYTVYYQSYRPKMTLQWTRAPKGAAPFVLKVTDPSDRTRSHRLTGEASVNLPGGSLREGKHSFVFTSADGRSSPTTHFKLTFDNNAPIARIRAPVEGVTADVGDRVTVRGEVIVGADLKIAGKEVSVDRAGRFSVLAPVRNQTVVMRVRHPRTGVHYYLRHLKGAP